MRLWTEDESDDLDRAIKAERAAEQRRVENKRARAKAKRIRYPKARQVPSGRWMAECTEAGRYYRKTFDTEDEAQAFLDAITNRYTEEQ